MRNLVPISWRGNPWSDYVRLMIEDGVGRASRIVYYFAVVIGLIMPAAWAESKSEQALADIHLHYKWNQKEVISPKKAIAKLRDQQLRLAVVTGTPAELALELADLAPDLVVPIYNVYRLQSDKSIWYFRKNLLQIARKALESGRYGGIGEIHLIGGFAPDWKQPNITGLFELAAEFDLPVLVHTEFSRVGYVTGFCQAHDKTRFLWAHAGSVLDPSEVEKVLLACPNLWVELSARDPWRFVGQPIADQSGRLKPAWEQLVLRYSDRFMVGSDNVWPVTQLDAWDQADTGWDEIGRFLAFHRGWLSYLPQEVQRKVGLVNGLGFFRH